MLHRIEAGITDTRRWGSARATPRRGAGPALEGPTLNPFVRQAGDEWAARSTVGLAPFGPEIPAFQGGCERRAYSDSPIGL